MGIVVKSCFLGSEKNSKPTFELLGGKFAAWLGLLVKVLLLSLLPLSRIGDRDLLLDGVRLGLLLPPLRLPYRSLAGVGDRTGDREREAERGEIERRGDLD